jgi:hypothetical protein
MTAGYQIGYSPDFPKQCRPIVLGIERVFAFWTLVAYAPASHAPYHVSVHAISNPGSGGNAGSACGGVEVRL